MHFNTVLTPCSGSCQSLIPVMIPFVACQGPGNQTFICPMASPPPTYCSRCVAKFSHYPPTSNAEPVMQSIEAISKSRFSPSEEAVSLSSQLARAISSNEEAAIETLLDESPELVFVLVDGINPLCRACAVGNKKIVALLLDKGADPEQKNSIRYYAAKDSASSIKENSWRGASAMEVAITSGHLDIVKLLMERRAKTEKNQDRHGRSALFIAVEAKQLSIVTFLLNHGSNPDIKNRYGMPLINLSVRLGAFEVFSALMKNDIDLQGADKERNTVLHEAASQRDSRFLTDLLIWEDALDLIDEVADDGRTPIARAVESGYLSNVNTLIKAGADLTLAYDGDKDLIQLAQEASRQVPDGMERGDGWEQIIAALEKALGHQ